MKQLSISYPERAPLDHRVAPMSVALAVNLVADELCGGRCEREVQLLCCHCYNRLDPKWEWAAHRAPDHAACLECGRSGRAADGMLYVVRPRG